MSELHLYIPPQIANEGAIIVQNAQKVDRVQSQTGRLDLAKAPSQGNEFTLQQESGKDLLLPTERSALILKVLDAGVDPNYEQLITGLHGELNEILTWMCEPTRLSTLPELLSRFAATVWEGINQRALIKMVGVGATNAGCLVRALTFRVGEPGRDGSSVGYLYKSTTTPFKWYEGPEWNRRYFIRASTSYETVDLKGGTPTKVDDLSWRRSLPLVALFTPDNAYDPKDEILRDHAALRARTRSQFQSLAVLSETYAWGVEKQRADQQANEQAQPVFIVYKK